MTPQQQDMYRPEVGTDRRTGKRTAKFETIHEAKAFMRQAVT